MGSAEKFCLRWNDFEANVSAAFREIREEKDFFDCTLSCGARQIQAHKLILSACSPFFRTVLRQNPHQHPLLYLKGVNYDDLIGVLNFMYHGEVNVAQDDLNSFLSVAEELQVKGLTQNKSADGNKEQLEANANKGGSKIASKSASSSKPSSKSRAGEKSEYQSIVRDDEEIQEVAVSEIKKEPQAVPLPTSNVTSDHLTSFGEVMDRKHLQPQPPESQAIGMEMATTDGYLEEDYEYVQYEEQAGVMDEYQVHGFDTSQGKRGGSSKDEANIMTYVVEDPGGTGYSCAICGKGFGYEKGHCKRHIRNVHNKSGEILFCEYCQKSYKNYDSLRHHQRTTHGVYKQ